MAGREGGAAGDADERVEVRPLAADRELEQAAIPSETSTTGIVQRIAGRRRAKARTSASAIQTAP